MKKVLTFISTFLLCLNAMAASFTGDVTMKWAMTSITATNLQETATLDNEDAVSYFSPTTYVIGDSITLGTSSWSGTTGSGTQMLVFKNTTSTDFNAANIDKQTVTLTTKMLNDGVFTPTHISFDAARFGTDGCVMTVILCAGKDEKEIISEVKPNRSGKSQELSSYETDVTGLSADADNPLVLKIKIPQLGKTRSEGMANLVITGTLTATSSDEPLAVTTCIPASGAADMARSGSIAINYNAQIKAGTGTATISDGTTTKTIEPTWSNRTLTFSYEGLEYGSSQTISIPEGYVIDNLTGQKKSAAFEYKFTVLTRPLPTARTINAVVDGSLTQLAHMKESMGLSGSGDETKTAYKIEATGDMPAQYRTIQAAIDDAPSNGTEPYIIYIKNGSYRDPNFSYTAGNTGNSFVNTDPSSTDATTQKISAGFQPEYGDSCRILKVNKPFISLVGQSRDGVIISTDRFSGSPSATSGNLRKRAWFDSASGVAVEITKNAPDAFLTNLSMDNENWTKLKMTGPQAHSIWVAADRAIFDNVATRSFQDTYKNDGTYNRSFWNNCLIEGSVDFIFGDADIWFEGCSLDINRQSGGYIVAPSHPDGTRWGYVFNNTRIFSSLYGSNCQTWLGRPWHNYPKTVFLNTVSEIKLYDLLWKEKMGGLPDIWAVYNLKDANGNAMSTTSRLQYWANAADGAFSRYDSRELQTDGTYNYYKNAKNKLTDEDVANYTIANVFSGDKTAAASGYWDPRNYVEKPSTPVLSADGTSITWNADQFAICYVVYVNGNPVAFPTACSYTANVGDVVTVQAMGERGALSEMSESVTATSPTAATKVSASASSNDIAYDLLGRKIDTQKGIIITNGKKVIR